ncbi:MAG: quinone-interacting membrane-bound oxidoreductase complex subunit QmoC [Deltaproteobacteria bacterium]|nr:quinone-interacting membrane-bound oxidoreductase complex subunit QmoC [Deltaproteobacteria bacterium]MCL5277959.1 quinone-interacting membrane-bound oxidoreductase complex subunit QmoC [Deltaproteobacteria bacterium]
MADNLVESDIEFVRDVARLGGGSLKKCFQCATCSVVCSLSSDEKPFPRKEMIWAQWGLKDRLLSDPDVWRCYQCGDCSVYCPRGAKPGEVMGAIRNYSFKSYAFPRFMGRLLSSPRYLPLLFAIPGVLFLIVLQHMEALSTVPSGPIAFTRFDNYVDLIFVTVSILVLLATGTGVLKFWKGMDRNNVRGDGYGRIGIGSSVFLAAKEVLTHNNFKKCDANNIRYLGHLSIFYGFAALFIVTSIVFIGLRVFHMDLPMDQTNPIKVLGNLGAVTLIAGCSIAVYNRLGRKEQSGESHYYDWFFLSVLSLIGVTGLLTEVVRLSGNAAAAYWSYFVHLVFVFSLIAYFPYSKFAHLIYRFVAIVYARYAGLDEPAEEMVSGKMGTKSVA